MRLRDLSRKLGEIRLKASSRRHEEIYPGTRKLGGDHARARKVYHNRRGLLIFARNTTMLQDLAAAAAAVAVVAAPIATRRAG